MGISRNVRAEETERLNRRFDLQCHQIPMIEEMKHGNGFIVDSYGFP
ncbi:MAG: hypothetical protein SV375_14940 [Thermodesulfobacteriota bacterium]|nr:hypothetical protein [Thermodesulfobacteriota bacterium]